MINKFGSGAVDTQALFEGLGDQMRVWMSHADKLSKPPANFDIIGHTDLHLRPLLFTTQNLFTVYNFIQKLPTLPMVLLRFR